jgi:trehalose 6-phosphate phosphatase
MRHLLECWNQVAPRLKSGKVIALFLDFDGTLARIRSRPEDVWMDTHIRGALLALVRNPRFRIWVISGRRQEDIRARIAVPGIRYLGLHGWEGSSSAALSHETRRILTCAKVWISGLLPGLPGVWLEDKDCILAVHYRSAPGSSVRRARRIVRGVVEPFQSSLKLVSGKKVWEVAPHEIEDKGVAVQRELADLSTHAVPVYLGDDAGDEPAFAALAGGVTVRVGSARVGSTHPSNARYRLAHVGQVRQFLEKLGNEFT